jgi:hypothetical protein
MNTEIIGAGPAGLYTAFDFLQADDPETHALITPPLQVAFDCLTRSGRVDMERLRELSPRFMAKYDQYLSTNGIEEKTV